MNTEVISDETDVVTGALSYTGKYITERLLSMGKRVITLTGHPYRPNPFGNMIKIIPFNFDRRDRLVEILEGTTTLYNTYWIRFPYANVTYDRTVENTKILIEAAKKAGVRRIVHISITNASEDSPFPYFRGKGILERTLMQSGVSYGIIRPTVLFGHEDVLINNIAWFLRHFPVFVIPGSGEYQLQPVFVEDVARIAVHTGQQEKNIVIDAAGPEIYTFNEMVRLIGSKIRSKVKFVHLKPKWALFLTNIMGWFVNDVVLTRDEINGLVSNLLLSKNPPTGCMKLSDWLTCNADVVGMKYASELNRHYR